MTSNQEEVAVHDTTGDVLNDPSILANLQSVTSDPRTEALRAYELLPSEVKRRVKALKKLQFKSFEVEAAFFKSMNDLEREFENQYAQLYDKRRNILTGDTEPNDEECDWKEDFPVLEDKDGVAAELAENVENKVMLAGDSAEGGRDNKGVPRFWLTIFNNVPLLADSKDECDDPVLESLQDIRCQINPQDGRSGFTLEFHFGSNDYFSDTVLKKEYFVRFDPSKQDPLGYEGPEIIESKGCTIHWKAGKNITVRTVKKTSRNKNRQEKAVSKTIKTDSFFNFFDPPRGSLGDGVEDLDEELEAELQSDFELGQYIREQVIPRAVMLYTGEGIDFDDEYESEDDEDEEDDDADQSRGRGSRHGSNKNSQQECKQQ